MLKVVLLKTKTIPHSGNAYIIFALCIASILLLNFSFREIFFICFFTVSALTSRRKAIFLYVIPLARRHKTSFSLGVISWIALYMLKILCLKMKEIKSKNNSPFGECIKVV